MWNSGSSSALWGTTLYVACWVETDIVHKDGPLLLTKNCLSILILRSKLCFNFVSNLHSLATSTAAFSSETILRHTQTFIPKTHTQVAHTHNTCTFIIHTQIIRTHTKWPNTYCCHTNHVNKKKWIVILPGRLGTFWHGLLLCVARVAVGTVLVVVGRLIAGGLPLGDWNCCFLWQAWTREKK